MFCITVCINCYYVLHFCCLWFIAGHKKYVIYYTVNYNMDCLYVLNYRNLEQMGLARKRQGWVFQSPRKDFYHRSVSNYNILESLCQEFHKIISARVVLYRLVFWSRVHWGENMKRMVFRRRKKEWQIFKRGDVPGQGLIYMEIWREWFQENSLKTIIEGWFLFIGVVFCEGFHCIWKISLLHHALLCILLTVLLRPTASQSQSQNLNNSLSHTQDSPVNAQPMITKSSELTISVVEKGLHSW